MKLLPVLAAFSLVIVAQPALADPAPAMTAPAAKYTLDTPIETLVANPAAKTVLDTDLPGLTTHPRYDSFKGMSLTALSGMAPDKLTPDRLAKVKADLAAIG